MNAVRSGPDIAVESRIPLPRKGLAEVNEGPFLYPFFANRDSEIARPATLFWGRDVAETITEQGKLAHMCRFLAHAPPGAVVEVGVYQGGSLARLAAHAGQRRVYGYDTFAGLPGAGPFDNCMRGGEFRASLEEATANLAGFPGARLVQGLYPATDLTEGPVALAHVDVDLYDSTYGAISHLWPLMAQGGRLYCDDALHHACEGATLACCRVAHERGRPFHVDREGPACFFPHCYFQF